MWSFRAWGRRLRTRRNALVLLPTYFLVKNFILDLPGRVGDSGDLSRWVGVNEGGAWWMVSKVAFFIGIVVFSLWPTALLPAPLRGWLAPAPAEEQEDSPPKATESEKEVFGELHRRSKRAKHWPLPQSTSVLQCQERVRFYFSKPLGLSRDTCGLFHLSFSQKAWWRIARPFA